MKISNPIVVLIALAAAAVAAPVFSAGFEPGFYVGRGFGQAHTSGGNSSAVIGGTTFTASGFDGNKTTFQVNGGYQFTEIWGLEVQYTDLGSHSGVIQNGTDRDHLRNARNQSLSVGHSRHGNVYDHFRVVRARQTRRFEQPY